MAMPRQTRRFLFPSALTLACLLGGGYGGLPMVSSLEAEPITRLCSNTECEGVTHCRYNSGITCRLEYVNGPCTNYKCESP